MDITQILLVSVVLVLTVILTLVGIEVFLIFREARRAIQKINKILDEVVVLSGSVSKQVTNVSELVATIKTIFDFVKVFFKKEKLKEKNEGNLVLEEGSRDGRFPEGESSIGPVRRFFTRAGKKLS